MPPAHRVLRIVINVLTVFSLLLAIGVAAQWVRWHPMDGRFGRFEGAVATTRWKAGVTGGWTFAGIALPSDPTRQAFFHQWHGFVYCDIEVPDTRLAMYVPVGRIHAVAIPNWLMLAALGGLPLTRAMTWMCRRRTRPGICRACGYDLRATPERCPECGAVAVPEAAHNQPL
jgi:hypothetical protein